MSSAGAGAAAWLRETVFSEELWFPAGTDFAAVEAAGLKVPRMEDLLLALALAAALTVLRLALNAAVYRPMAARLLPRYPDAVAPLPSRAPGLERLFRAGVTSLRKDSAQVRAVAREEGMTETAVKEWFRFRRRRSRAQKALNKWLESCWRFTYYAFALAFGAVVLRGKEWAVDLNLCWKGYPYQEVSDDVRWFYLMQLGIYVQLLFTQFVEERKKDFVEMVVHHVATIILVLFSYYANFVRIGVLVLVVHDASDPFLELAKLLNYARFQRLCDACFVCFAVTFGVTRLYVYPFHVFWSAYFESYAEIGYWNSWGIFNALLGVLQLLHLYWFWIIVRMVYGFLAAGKVAKDGRSQTEEDSEADDCRAAPAAPSGKAKHT